MMATIEELKKWFSKGQYPTQGQFWAWLESYRHKGEAVGMADVAGLAAALNGKYEASEGRALEVAVGAMGDDLEQARREMGSMLNLMAELRGTLTDRSYTLDFGERGMAMQDVNMEGEAVEVVEVRAFNVARLMVTSGEMVRREVDVEDPGWIRIASGGLATWEIERVVDGMPASVGIRCRRTGGVEAMAGDQSDINEMNNNNE